MREVLIGAALALGFMGVVALVLWLMEKTLDIIGLLLILAGGGYVLRKR